MDGILLIDKPEGPTSHDVVARIRRTSGERRIGHTGTLDPRASGLLPLVLGRATRLAQYLTGSDKTYEATVRLGYATDTDDADGRPLGAPGAHLPDDAAIQLALAAFVGTIEQLPPQHSAKKVEGRRAYDLARRQKPVALLPARVRLHALDWLGREGDLVRLRLTTGPGFYVRSLARDLGERLGCGGHLAGLRRLASGGFTVEEAIPLEDAERMGPRVAGRIVPPSRALPEALSVVVTATGELRVRHGNSVGPQHLSAGPPAAAGDGLVKVLAADGSLLALAQARGGALHPTVVLG
jgi:tRNA pseudouridine55 synthase